MKKSTLLYSVLLGVGSVFAGYSVISDVNQGKFQERAEKKVETEHERNNDYFDLMRRNEVTGIFEVSDYENAVRQIKSQRAGNAALGLNWSFMGPNNVGGLTRAIVIDKDDNTRLYAAAEGGGVWLSTNSGGSWTFKSDGWVNLNVASMAQDLDGILYAGTGINYGSTPGGGIYISTDRGESWSLLPSSIPSSTNNAFYYVNRLVTSKTKNSQGTYTLYAATEGGLYVSLDHGDSWIRPMTLPNCTGVLSGGVDDIVINGAGRVFVAYNGGLYISDAGETVCSYFPITDGIGTSSRMSLAACPNDPNIVYAYQAFAGDRTFKVLKSSNGGTTWFENQPAPPTPAIDSTFEFLGFNPVQYNQAIAVDPADCDNIYVGAVDMYRVSGAWTSVATRFPIQPFYVHVDHHFMIYDPTNPNIFYSGNDGGIFRTANAAAGLVNWTANNRNYGTTLYYDVATSPTGQVVGGTQDNGNLLVDPNFPGVSGEDAQDLWTLGDGFDSEASAIGPVAFVTSQYGNVGRDSYLPGGSGGVQIHVGGSPGTGGVAPFRTVIRLWESKDDLTSKDSVLFLNDTSRFSVGNGDGNRQIFTGTLRKVQKSAKIVPGKVRLVDIAGGQFADDSSEPGILKSFGDSVGFIDYNTGDFSVRWSFPPPLGSSVNSVFNVSYDAGDTLNLLSANQDYPFDYVLTTGLNTNDSVKIQDPIQALLVVGITGAFRITREALYEDANPLWIEVAAPTATSFEFSNDGNHLYIGGINGTVTRVTGLNDLYNDVVPDSVLTLTTIFQGNAAIGDMSMHPTDPNKLLVTTGGFSSSDHVFELTNAQTATSSANAGRRNLQGNLPFMPVYDPEYNINKPNQVLIGTELGLWSTDNINTPNPVWTNESGEMGLVRVLDVVQQRLPFNEATNYGQFYLGTYGRGVWTSRDLVGFEDSFDDFTEDIAISNLKLYPNPAITQSRVVFDMPVNGTAEISIHDISGKLVQRNVQPFGKGEVYYDFSVQQIPAGTYFISVKVGSAEKHARFVVLK